MIYIAGKYTAQARLREMRDKFRKAGFNVSSFWLDEVETDASASPEKMEENALRDVKEVKVCSTFILDTLDESATGGREVELGLALANKNADVILVGPRRNVFHHLIGETYENWDEVMSAFCVGVD